MSSLHRKIICHAVELIRDQENYVPAINNFFIYDSNTFKLFQQGNTTGVYQFESNGMRHLLHLAKPNCFNDLVALIALYRPTPLDSGVMDTFIHNKNSNERPAHDPQELNLILKETYGVIAFLEQVVEILKILGRMDEIEIDGYLKAMKESDCHSVEKYRGQVFKKVDEKNISVKHIKTLLDQIEAFGRFPITRAKCAANALISYQMAYLKANFLTEFLAAWIAHTSDTPYEFQKFIRECNRNGIELSLPDINLSEKGCKVSNGKIRLGLRAVKSIDSGTVDAILVERQRNGDFKSLLHFCNRVDQRHINKNTLSGLIHGGAFDFSGISRPQMIALLGDVNGLSHKSKITHIGEIYKIGNKQNEDGSFVVFPKPPDIDDWDALTKIKKQYEALGTYINGHPSCIYKKKINRTIDQDILSVHDLPDEQSVCVAGIITEVKVYKTKSGGRMAFCYLEDALDIIEIHVFQKQYDEGLLIVGNPVLVEGILKRELFFPENKIWVREIYALE